jgi:hypothetical protein
MLRNNCGAIHAGRAHTPLARSTEGLRPLAGDRSPGRSLGRVFLRHQLGAVASRDKPDLPRFPAAAFLGSELDPGSTKFQPVEPREGTQNNCEMSGPGRSAGLGFAPEASWYNVSMTKRNPTGKRIEDTDDTNLGPWDPSIGDSVMGPPQFTPEAMIRRARKIEAEEEAWRQLWAAFWAKRPFRR